MPYNGKNIMRVCGGTSLNGTVKVQGSKNAVLPMMAACTLIKGKTIIHNCPAITDVFYMKKLLQSIGCRVVEYIEEDAGRTIAIDATEISCYRFPNEYAECMRSSIVLLGPVLSRMGSVILKQPGGCTIGDRPIDLHISALEKLGASIKVQDDTIYAQASRRVGADILFARQSVGATENAILYAVCAEGKTVLHNASVEPEILELCRFLKTAGAKIQIEYNTTGCYIIIEGVSELMPIQYHNVNDRIVAGTYAFAGMIAGGDISLTEVPVSYMKSTIDVLEQMGAKIIITDVIHCSEQLDKGTLRVISDRRPLAVPYLETAVYPGFPTDMQSAFLTTACIACGKTIVSEQIFENRFKILPELKRMGAKTALHTKDGKKFVEIEGVQTLQGCNVLAKELRGGAALVLAGLCATGITTVGNIHFIRRGYENMERDLKRLGARISLGNEND